MTASWMTTVFRHLLALLTYLTIASCQAQQPANVELPTVAEKSNYTRTSRQPEVDQFLTQLTVASVNLSSFSIGSTVENRSITAVIAANPPVKRSQDLVDDTRLVVFLLGNIHAGECAGKEAIMALLRDIAMEQREQWMKHFVIIAIPNFNADANARQGLHHRPAQVGPSEGMGLRENVQGLDLNRDFMKLETPEVRALVRALNDWNPHVFIDTHTTNGSRHRYALTYDIPHNPAAPPAGRHWLRTQLLPQVTERLLARDINTWFYGNFNADKSRWTTFGHEPRHSTEYVGLRGGLAILSEAYTYVSYRERIEAHYAFLTETLNAIARQPKLPSRIVSPAQRNAHKDATFRQSIRAENGPYPEKVKIQGYADPQPGKDDSTKPPGTAGQPQDYTVTYYANFKSTLQVPRPYAYLLGREFSRVAERLRWHGLELYQLQKPQRLNVESQQVSKIDHAKTALQGHRLTTLTTSPKKNTLSFAAGTYVIYTDQPRARLLTYLLEPQSDDGLTTWNFFDHALGKGKLHPVSKLIAPTELATERVERIVPSSRLTLDKIYGPKGRISFGGSFPLSLSWVPDSADYKLTKAGATYRVDAETGSRRAYQHFKPGLAQAALVDLLQIPEKEATKLVRRGGEASPTGKETLFLYHNDLVLYEHETSTARRLTTDKQAKRLVTFSPDATQIAFIRKHNLFVVPVDGGKEISVTTSGSEEQLYGYLDWVYQEELYGRGNFRGFWWSPNSRSIAFLHLDERPVSRYTIADHLAYREKSRATYYPKAGDPLPKVALAIFSLDQAAPRWIDLTSYGDEFLISHVSWSAEGQDLYYQVQDRQQSWLDLCRSNLGDNRAQRLFRETTEAWVQSPGGPVFLKDGSFLWLTERSGYRHVLHISNDGQSTTSVTTGKWEVQRLLGVDPKEDFVYLLANKDSATETHGYRVSLDGGELQRLTQQAGNHVIRFNDAFSHFIDYVSGVHRPISVFIHRADGTRLRTLAPNLVDYLDYYDLNKPEFVTFAARDGHQLNAILIKPPNFDPAKRYPVLCHVYGGPQAPAARNRWNGSTYLWHQYLAQQGYVIWISDNRAATHQGAVGAWPIHRQMGQTELRDLEDGVKWLGKHPWIDSSRIGIWGWSYGGYLVSYALTHSKLFKAGIAGAPVTDWRNYDAIYTERYMGLPKENVDGYKKASPVHAAANLHGRLLLVHGSLDDNVHLSNTLQFSNALQNAGKQFQLMIYPNNRHGITRSQQSRHLRDLMTQFILENL